MNLTSIGLPKRVRVGTAGWSIPRAYSAALPDGGSHLRRYARRLWAVEIDSTFYRAHCPATYARWAAEVPADFQFAVKLPREITHVQRLATAEPLLSKFLGEIAALGPKLGPLLIRLPLDLEFTPAVAEPFLELLRRLYAGPVACEPGHPSWYTPEAGRCLARHRVARVAADPAVVPLGAQPGGCAEHVFYRLHGSPHTYASSYSADCLRQLAETLRSSVSEAETWCIFDNTAEGASISNALALQELLS
jgi:uncharacterized protein YecE (DUF72 family)